MADPILQAVDVSKRFPLRESLFSARSWKDAVSGVTLKLHRGESVALVGESGCGKSTLARLLCRLAEPTEGRVLFRGKPLGSLRGAGLMEFRRAVQLVFQDPMSSLNPLMRIGAIVAEPMRVHRSVPAGDVPNRVASLLAEVGLDPSWTERPPHTLSGGQRQRVGIARALSLDPELLVCDEPVSSLDLSVQAQILNLLAQLQARRGLGMLFISHNLATVSAVADRILVMRAGRVLEEGQNPQLFQSPRDPYTRTLVRLAAKAL